MVQRRPATFCVDCGRPISNAAIRCQRCAMRRRAGLSSPPVRRPEHPPQRRWDTLTPEEIRQIRDADTELQAAILAHRLDVDPAVVRTIRGAFPDTGRQVDAPLVDRSP